MHDHSILPTSSRTIRKSEAHMGARLIPESRSANCPPVPTQSSSPTRPTKSRCLHYAMAGGKQHDA